MSGRFTWGACLLAAALTGAGCWNARPEGPSGGTYRTVTADPGRDTEAAKRANEIGLGHLARGDLNQAADEFRRALRADVMFGPAHNNLGLVYYKQGHWHEAATEFDDACRLLPRYAEPRYNLGLVLEVGRKADPANLDRAIEQYREAIRLDPDNIQYPTNLVRALMMRGDRTDEVRLLLDEVILRHHHPEWREWARRQQAILAGKPESRPIVPAEYE